MNSKEFKGKNINIVKKKEDKNVVLKLVMGIIIGGVLCYLIVSSILGVVIGAILGGYMAKQL